MCALKIGFDVRYNIIFLHFIPRQPPDLFLWVDMVPKFVGISEKAWRRDDAKETSYVQHDQRAQGVFRAKHATGKDELCW